MTKLDMPDLGLSITGLYCSPVHIHTPISCIFDHASHMQHHRSYNTHHAASGIDHTTPASNAWHLDTTGIYDARRRQQLCIAADRSKTNFRAASSSSSTQSPHPLPSSSSSSLHYTAA